MIYIPMFKNRMVEYGIAKEMKDCFSDKIIPLFEVVSEKYATRYERNEETGEYVLKLCKTQKRKVKCKPTEADIITLQDINTLIDKKPVFIDFFRFSTTKYGRNVDIKSAELAWNISQDYNLYKEKVLSVTEFKNMIPVISVKPDYGIKKTELQDFLMLLQRKTKSIALRITDGWIEEYEEIMREVLREEDYLLFDVEEQNPELKFMEIEELIGYEMSCKIILVNSPRKAKINNGEYPEHDITDLINNSARQIASENGLYGYGDYCGLKDNMPSKGGSNGQGAALALLFDYKENVFYSYSNHDTSKGQSGYIDLILLIKADEAILDSSKDCPIIRKINGMTGHGGWTTWIHINGARYISQTYRNM